jgi:hypothetical protein
LTSGASWRGLRGRSGRVLFVDFDLDASVSPVVVCVQTIERTGQQGTPSALLC